MAAGQIIERKRLGLLLQIWRYNKLWFFQDILPALLIFLLNIFRRAGLLIANPWHFYEIVADFDLVHCHVFPVSLSGSRVPPLIVSNATTAGLFLKGVNKLSALRIWLMECAEIILCRLFGVTEPSLFLTKAAKVIVFSDFMKLVYP